MAKKERLSLAEFYYAIKTMYENDCYLADFLDGDVLEDFFEYMLDYDIVFIASDDRILFTSHGENLFQKLAFAVELSTNPNKVYRNEH